MRSSIVAFAFGLLVLAGLTLFAEGILRVLPDEVFPKEARNAPPLVQEDQVNIVFRKNGFRGKWPCTDCPPDLVRVITMGGSSTMGIPMLFAGRTYAAELQRMLDERRPGEHYEVLNAGIGGFGITQVYAALKEELLQYKPDIVTVSSWFNDTAPSPGWYSIPGISDWEAYEQTRRLQRVQAMPGVQTLRGSRLYAFARHYLLSARRSALGRETPTENVQRPRSTPEEFRQVLEKIVALGDEHNFLPVLLYEPKSRTASREEELASNPYLQVVAQVAESHQLPLVDTLTPLARHRQEWLFYDFIHPNPMGHTIIAEALYDALHGAEQSPRAAAFWKARGIEVGKPEAVRNAQLQLETAVVKNRPFQFEVRAPFLTKSRANLLVAVGERPPLRMGSLGTEFVEVEMLLDQLDEVPPIADLAVSAERAEAPSFPIGQSGASSPVGMEIRSGGRDFGWTVGIAINGVRKDQNYRGYNAVLVSGVTGEVLDAAVFDIFGSPAENDRLLAFLDAAAAVREAKPPIVVLAVHTDGGHNVDAEKLSGAFRRIGGSGRLPKPFESFVLVGSPGAAAETAIEESGPRLIDVSIGDPSLAGELLVEVRVRPQPGLLPVHSGGVVVKE
ncbi:MAG: hypothetical protein KDD69_13030 [Bdellovibrionales bacterium]|nr:hypothetical protein [Bdellovibrionales bacterium]